MEMKERVLMAGENYIVTTKCRYPEPLTSLSILVYNFDDNVCKSLKRIGSNQDLLRVIRNYDGEAEFLVRCTGLSGQFRVLRYRMDRENLTGKIEAQTKQGEELSDREKLLSSLSEKPSISSATYFSSDALSLRSVFKGIGSELIFIDLKDSK
jgi:hypothetical protein